MKSQISMTKAKKPLEKIIEEYLTLNERQLLFRSFQSQLRQYEQLAAEHDWLPSELAASKADIIMVAKRFGIEIG